VGVVIVAGTKWPVGGLARPKIEQGESSSVFGGERHSATGGGGRLRWRSTIEATGGVGMAGE